MKQSVDDALDIRLATAIDRSGGVEPQPPPETAEALAPARKKDKRKSPSNIPPYALNPHRVATITDIESRTRRLFAPLKVPVDKALVMKLATFKPVAVNRNASTVAAYFNRQIENDLLLPKQRKAVQRVNKKFFEIRRSIFSDDRLTKQDKAQLVSVLTFERIKAREAIHNPHINSEATYMGSAEIRELISEEPQPDFPEYSISGPGFSSPVRDRVKSLVSRLRLQTNGGVSKERERELSAKDIYTKKSRFSQNVHYLSKSTDKTLFVDTGTAIAMRRTGITEAGVGVALQLAAQRFGSTLTINGSAEFKRLVVEAAAKGGMDVHFTDKKMNEALTLRRAELDIANEGQQIQSPDAAQADAEGTQAIIPGDEPAPAVVDRSIVVGELVAHGSDSYRGDAKNGPSYYVTLNTETGPKTLWGVALEEVMSGQDFVQGERITLKDLGRETVTIRKPQPDGSFKEIPGFRRAWSAERDTTSVARTEPIAAPLPQSTAPAAPQAAAASALQAATVEKTAAPVQPPAQARAPLNFEPSPDTDPRDRDWHVDNMIMEVLERHVTVLPDPMTEGTNQEQTFSAFVGDLKIDTYQSREVAEQRALGDGFAFFTSDQLIEQLTRLEQLAPSAPVKESPGALTPAVGQTQSQSELVRREQAWRDKFPLTEDAVLTEAEVLSSDVMMGLRGEDHAMWLVATSDHTKEGVAMITAYMENDVYRDRFKRTIEDLYDQHQDSPEIIKSLDEATDFVEPVVHEIEARLWAAEQAQSLAQDTPAPLNFTHNGEAASLGLRPVPDSTSPVVEPAAAVPRVEAPAPLNFTHNGQPAALGLNKGAADLHDSEPEASETVVVETIIVNEEEYGPEMN